MTPKTKILLVDDHPLVREWLTKLINEEPDFEVCVQTGTAREALGLIETLLPRIVVVDISLDGSSGLELIKDVKAIHPKVDMIVLSMHDEMLYAERAMRAGAAGYIMKREATKKVLDAIRTVIQGGLYFSNAVNAMLAQKLVQGAGDQPASIGSLSDRELDVFRLLGSDLDGPVIARELSISLNTLRTHTKSIYAKLGVTSRRAAVSKGAELNLH